MYKVYAIQSVRNKTIYVGMSKNIRTRLKEHNTGKVKSTKPFRPWKIIFYEEYGISRVFARKREKYYKSGFGKEFLKNIPW